MRDLEGDLSILQRVVEFLPIPSSTRSRNTVKALSRAWRTAARRALTRGRWKPLRTLDNRVKRELWLAAPELRPNVPGLHSAFNRDAREAWALYPGEVLLLILNWNALVAVNYLLLVVESTKQGFGSIVAAFEKMLQLERRRLTPGHPGAVLYLLDDWSRQAMPGSLPNDNMWVLSERLATPEWLGDALGRWTDPASVVKVVDVLIEHYHEDWHPRYDDLARSMSANWADSGKRARFVALLAQRQAQEDEDMMMRDQEAPPIVDDGMYNHL
jgi:hypothetical protein